MSERKITVYVTTVAEPSFLHGISDDKIRRFLVHLAYDATEDQAGTLLNKSDWPFGVYKLDGGKAKLVEKTKVSLFSENTASGEPVLEWLKSRKAFPASGDASIGTGNVIATKNTPALHLLMGSISWDSPLPYLTNLSRQVVITRDDADPSFDDVFILPSQEKELNASVANSQIIVTIPNLDSLVNVEIVTLKLPKEERLDARFFEDSSKKQNGFLKPTTSDDDFRFITTLEKSAGSLFASFHALLDLPVELFKSDETARKALAKIGCKCAIDPILLSLMMPGAANREGMVLAPLFAEYAKRNPSGSSQSVLIKLRANLQDVVDKLEIQEYSSIATQLDIVIDESTIPSTLTSLRTLASALEGEAGCEKVLLYLLKEAIELTDPVIDELKSPLEEYRRILSKDFNGAEAVRQDCGRLICDNFWAAYKGKTEDPTEFLKDAKSNPWLGRIFGRDQEEWLNDTLGCLVKFNNIEALLDDMNDMDDMNQDKTGLQSLWGQTIDKTFRGGKNESSKYRPDQEPAPLTVKIADDSKPYPEFSKGFNGIAVALKRDDKKWAHANLVEIKSVGSTPIDERIVLKPFLPHSVDERSEMFLKYYGYPLSSPAFLDTKMGFQIAEKTSPFYQILDVDFKDTGFEPPPVLAYGSSYQVAAFAVTKGGTVPKVLQASDKPWRLKKDFEVDKVLTRKIVYQRTTAIGSTTFESSGKGPQIGGKYPDVHPLSLDYPKYFLSCSNDGHGAHVDLFRYRSGKGMLHIASKTLTLKLDQFKVYSPSSVKSVKLRVTVFNKPNIKPSFAETDFIKQIEKEIPVDQGPKNLELLLEGLDGHIKENVWVRIEGVADSSASVSFACADAENELASSDWEQPQVLLLGDSKANIWKSDFIFSGSDGIVCQLPRVTWLDWEHWYQNDKLTIHGKNHSDFKKAYLALNDASVMRLEDEDNVSRQLDRIPDPAVQGFLVELIPTDSIEGSGNKPSVLSIFYDHSERLTSTFKSAPTAPASSGSNDAFLAYFKELRGFLESLTQSNQLKIIPSVGEKVELNHTAGSNEVRASVLAGSAAVLRVRPLVPVTFFGTSTALAEGLEQIATGKINKMGVDYYLFPGANLTLEGMVAPRFDKDTDRIYRDILDEHVKIVATNNTRSYQIRQIARGDTQPWFRSFSDIVIRTQRWRSSGRPIYNWITPEKKDKGDAADVFGEAVFEVNRNPDFEDQLFFEREDIDCEVTRVRLNGKDHPLQSISWESPSATYFRHGFTLISRYSGAIKRGINDRTWPINLPPWEKSIVVLAESSRLEVTQPQVRCLIPMSGDANQNDVNVVVPSGYDTPKIAPTPPLLAYMEEKPFAVGGLADRVLAEIVTNIGFGFDEKDGSVTPVDLGKETSRDGRIDARSWKNHRSKIDGTVADDVSAMFYADTEGPIGLHFETQSTPTSTWANTQYVIRPRSLSVNSNSVLPEESFVGVRFRRMLDPNWVVKLQKDEGTEVSILRNWEAVFKVPKGTDTSPLLKVDTTAVVALVGNESIAIDRQFLSKNVKSQLVTLAKLPVGWGKFSLVHSTAGDGKCTLSVLAYPNTESADVKQGISNVPKLLASIDWIAPQNASTIAFEKCECVRPITLSSSTFREWGRTARNMQWLYNLDANKDSNIVPTGQLRAKFAKATKTLSFTDTNGNAQWLIPSTSNSRLPTEVHRFLTAFFLRKSENEGKRFDLFSGACVLSGKTPKIPFSNLSELELVEAEVPARVVCGLSNPDSGFSNFETAKFDLLSSGGVYRAGSDRCYRFHVRFANSFQSMKKASGDLLAGKKFGLILTADSTDYPQIDIPKDKTVRACDLLLDPAAKVLRLRWHLWDGEFYLSTIEPITSPSVVEKFSVKFANVPASLGEIWADVSVLHYSKRAISETAFKDFEFDYYDFDWSFSLDSAESEERNIRMNPATLSARPEAQAIILPSSESVKVTMSEL